MKYIVQKIPSRDIAQISSVVNCDIVEDFVFDPVGCFIKCAELANNEAWVRLEDDVELCNGFKYNIEKAISGLPGEIISFFTLRKITENKRMRANDFCMFQCVYIPPGLSTPMIEFYNTGEWQRETKNPKDPDVFFREFMKRIGVGYWIWSPSLVQHKEVVSGIDPRRSKKRQAHNFVG